MTKLTITHRHKPLVTFDGDWEGVEFHGLIRVSSVYVDSRGTEINLLEPEAASICIARNDAIIWIVNDEVNEDPGPDWERLYPACSADEDYPDCTECQHVLPEGCLHPDKYVPNGIEHGCENWEAASEPTGEPATP